jgi:hypothetical protein
MSRLSLRPIQSSLFCTIKSDEEYDNDDNLLKPKKKKKKNCKNNRDPNVKQMKTNVWLLPSASSLFVHRCFISLLVNKNNFPTKSLLPVGGIGPNKLPVKKTSNVSNTLK